MAEDERDYKADPGRLPSHTRPQKEQSGNSGPPPR
jgi:hypothetical protein